MSRLSDALRSSQKQPTSALFSEFESGMRAYFRKDVARIVEHHIAEMGKSLAATSEMEREKLRAIAKSATDGIADEVMKRVGEVVSAEVAVSVAAEVASALAKRPLDIQQPITQVIEKPIERIVEKPNPLTAMKVKRVDGRITELNTNKGKFKVSRDEDGLITGVTKA
jgi:hypothetical protein